MKATERAVRQLAFSFAIIRYCMCSPEFVQFRRHPAPSRRLLDPVRKVNDVAVLKCCALCNGESICAAVNYCANTRTCELVGAKWKEDTIMWAENDDCKVYSNVNDCDYTEHPEFYILGYDGSVYEEPLNDCKEHCWEKDDDCKSFDYDITSSKCYFNTVTIMEAKEAGAMRYNSSWRLFSKTCED